MLVGDLFSSIETDLTCELIDLIDKRLIELAGKSVEANTPDELGYLDSMEYLTGLGFVTCQYYMCAVYGSIGVNKKVALQMGPFHVNGESIACIVNAAANYWKHNNEWPLDRNSKQRELIEAAFDGIGYPVGTDYALSGLLTEISHPESASFTAVVRKLELWKVEVRGIVNKV